ncbi:MAG: transglutaminase domain-containing protein [Flavobacterium sp.]
MKFVSVICVIFFMNLSFGQTPKVYSVLDGKTTKIPDSLTTTIKGISKYIQANFQSEEDKIRAVFYWTASNISYDVTAMNAPNNFGQSSNEKIELALKTRKGVCMHYAEVFNAIANNLGIKTYIVDGYTKQNGRIVNISHSWCASKIDGKWFLFDPTWGAGYVDGGRFFKKLNNSYFKVTPAKMINSHMPFDYMWEFLNTPISNFEFYNGIISGKGKENFNFEKEIEKYDNLSEVDKLFESSERVEKNGLINNLTKDYYFYKRNNFQVLIQNNNIAKYNSIIEDYNQAVNELNGFIYYRNIKFKPLYSDENIAQMIQSPYDKLKKCNTDISNLGSIGKENSSEVYALKSQIGEALKQAEIHYAFVQEYLSKSKNDRKKMFAKTSWLGIPLF